MKAYDSFSFHRVFAYRSRLQKKTGFIFSVFFLIGNIVSAATYYSNNGDPSVLSKWWTNTNGTGSHPSDFSTSDDIFILQSGQTCTTGNNNDWTIGSGVTLIVDGTLNINGNNSDVDINGTIIFTSSNSVQVVLGGSGSGNSINIYGTVKTANVNGLQGASCSMPVNATKKTVSYGSSATFEFNAGPNQNTLGLPSSIKNLIVNCSLNVTINASISVTNAITLTSGILVIPTGLTINLTSGNAILGSGFGSATHINTQSNSSTGAQGFFRVGNITSTYIFPIGNGTYYLPVTLSASGTSDFSVGVFQGATINGTPNGTAFSVSVKQTIVDAIWVVNRNVGSSTATMQLSWPNALEGSTFSTYPDNGIGISHYSGSWDMTSGVGNQSANIATRNAISSFSPFMVGESSIPLSLKFDNIEGYVKNNGIQIKWSSLNEADVDHYDIERSNDGQLFRSAGQIKAGTDLTSSKDYSWFDSSPLNDGVFYRIKAVEQYGKFMYSKIIKIAAASLYDRDVILYPNPVRNDHITMRVEGINAGEYHFIISDITGRQVYSASFDHPGGILNESIQLPTGMHQGIYSLKLICGNINVGKTFLVQ